MLLNAQNYVKGVLVDQDLMGGVTTDPQKPGQFIAFVINHMTGEYLGYQSFLELEPALQTINAVKREWTYSKVGGCGNGSCGKEGGCSKGSCAGGGCKTGAC